jgi:hypothetical protein
MVRILDTSIRGNESGTSSGGVFASAPVVTIERCVIEGNWARWGSAGGIGLYLAEFVIQGCLISGNTSDEFGMGGRVGIESSSGVIDGCTITRNAGSPPSGGIDVTWSSVAIGRSIVASNTGRGFSNCYESTITVACCDVAVNTDGNEICGADLGGNFSLDPLFCDAENGDYRLDGNSPCLPGNHPDGVDCGLIGALGWGCGTLPTGACCFEDGTCVLLEQEDCETQQGAYQGDVSDCEPNPCEPTVVVPESWGRVKALFR